MTLLVRTGARLHFGLLNPWNAEGSTARRFGGVGLMVKEPSVHLRVEPAAIWSAEGPLASRVLAFASRFQETLQRTVPPQRFIVERAPPEHCGFGTGTQLGMAVARALAHVADRDDLPTAELARSVGRGERSALGIHGFAQGGFLVEVGKRDPKSISPLALRLAFPAEWRVLLVIPRGEPGCHGNRERRAFETMNETRGDERSHDAMCRLILMGMVPGLLERDLERFGAALQEYNERAGAPYVGVQGGIYGAKAAAEIRRLQILGVHGVGQSSWGPAVFGIVEDEGRAEEVVRCLGETEGRDVEVIVSSGRNGPAEIVES